MAVHQCPSLMLLRLRRAWRHSAARRCARLPAGSPSCEGYVLTGSRIVRMCSRVPPRSTRSTTCSLLAGPLCCSRPASSYLRRATLSWTKLGATGSARTLVTAHRARPEHIHATATRGLVVPFTTGSQCWPLAHFCSACRLGIASAAAVAATAQRRAACVCVCVRRRVRVVSCEGRSRQRFRQRKPR